MLLPWKHSRQCFKSRMGQVSKLTKHYREESRHVILCTSLGNTCHKIYMTGEVNAERTRKQKHDFKQFGAARSCSCQIDPSKIIASYQAKLISTSTAILYIHSDVVLASQKRQRLFLSELSAYSLLTPENMLPFHLCFMFLVGWNNCCCLVGGFLAFAKKQRLHFRYEKHGRNLLLAVWF